MARTDEAIQQSLVESLQNINPSIDVNKGPIYDFLVRPVPPELAETEGEVDRLAKLMTLQIDEVITTEELEALATNLSISLGQGVTSKGSVTYYTARQPTEDLPIARGSLVGTDDSLLTYFVTDEDAVLPVSGSSSYYNAQRRRYEITVNIEATAVGPDYDLPPQRIRQLITPIDGFDGVVNLTRTRGGVVQEDIQTSINRVRVALAGKDPETGGGILSDIYNSEPEAVLAVSLVYPKDRPIFKRKTNRPAIDAYIYGEDPKDEEQTLIASGGEQTIVLENSPVLSVENVTVNDNAVSYAFVPDTSLELGGSTRGNDVLILEEALVTNDVLEISYSSNVLIRNLQDDLFGGVDVHETEGSKTFNTDILARMAREVEVAIVLDVVISSSFDVTRTGDEIETKLYELIEAGTFGDLLQPEIIRQKLTDEVGGISSLRVRRFNRTSGSTKDIEVIALQKNEIALIDSDILEINVRQ